MFKIGEFSRLTQVTVKALRHYDRLGLLPPAQIDPFTGYRAYSAAQLPRLNRLLALKDLGLALEQIGPFLDADLSPEQLRALLLVKQGETRRRIDEESRRLARIETRLAQMAEPERLACDVVVKRVEAQPVVSLRRTLPERRAIGGLFRQLHAYEQRHHLAVTDRLVIWHDQEFRDSGIDVEAAFVTIDPPPPDDAVQARELPAATLACLVHAGPTETIGQACMALLSWVEPSGYRLAGPERVRAIERSDREGQNSVAELQLPVAWAAGAGGPGRVASEGGSHAIARA
jgi:DNA-binding transcriptional MerR regulator